ncbi:MAG: dihydrofolate reductase [Lachnospiraceae bacterium]|nr:dihydrofolate reductase [Lachnospiraceae bacterium]
MNMIVAVDKNWAIGNKGSLLVRIPADHKMFRSETMGKVVVLGRKTLETFPHQEPLEGRTNIILSHNKHYKAGDAIVVASLEELIMKLRDYDDKDIYIIGGASVYELMLPYVDTVHVTKIDHEYEADAFFPNLDASGEWEITADSDEQVYFDLTYRFLRYQRKKSQS